MKFERKLKELGLELPAAPKPVANYVTAVRSGNLVFLSGHDPVKEDGTSMQGDVHKKLRNLTGIQ